MPIYVDGQLCQSAGGPRASAWSAQFTCMVSSVHVHGLLSPLQDQLKVCLLDQPEVHVHSQLSSRAWSAQFHVFGHLSLRAWSAKGSRAQSAGGPRAWSAESTRMVR
jgi:hypothetical protein